RRMNALSRKRVDVRLGFPAVPINLPKCATGAGDIKMSVSQRRMKYRFFTREPEEPHGEIACVWLWFPIGRESPSEYGLVVLPIVTHHVPLDFVPRIRPAMRSVLPVANRMARRILPTLPQHVKTVTVD